MRPAGSFRSWLFALSVTVCFLAPRAMAITSAASGDWNVAATWVGGVVPNSSDPVVIADGHTVTVTTTADAAASVTINGSISSGTFLVINPGAKLTVSGTVTINDGGFVNTTLDVGDGSLVCGDLNIAGGVNGGLSTLKIASGTAQVANLLVTSSTVNTRITFTGPGKLSISGNMASGATLTNYSPSPGSTIEYNGSAAQSVGTYSYNHLTIANSSSNPVTANGIIGVAFQLTVSSGSLVIANGLTPGAASSLIMTGTSALKIGDNSATFSVAMPNFPGGYSLATGTTIEYGAAFSQTIASSVPYQNLYLRNGGGLLISKTLSGNTTVAGDLTVDQQATGSITLDTNNFSLTVDGSVFGDGALDMSAGGTLRIVNGTFSNTITFTPGTSGTVEYAGSGQAVRATTYMNLVIDGGNVILAGATSATNATINSGKFLTLSGNSLTLSGDLTVNGTISGITGSVLMSGFGGTMSGSGAIYPAVTANSSTITGSLLFGGNFTIGASSTITNTGATDIDLSLDGPSGSTWINDAGSTLNIGGHAMVSGGTLAASATSNTVTYDGIGGQTVAAGSYDNLVLTGSGVKTMQPGVNVATDFSVTGSAAAITLDDLVIGGNVLIASTASLDGNGFFHQVGGNWSSNNKYTSNGSTVSFNGASATQTIGATTFDDVEFLNAAPKVLAGAIVANGNFSIVSATVSGGTGLTHSVRGNWVNSGSYVAQTSTVVFDGASLSTVDVTPFYDVTVNGAGITLSGNSSVSNNLLISSGDVDVAATALTLNNLTIDAGATLTPSSGLITISGNIVTNGAIGGTDGTVALNGTAIQTWTGAAQSIFDLTINKSAGTLNPSVALTINGTLTMTNGSIVAPSPAAIIIPSGLLSHTAGHIKGRLTMTHTAAGTKLYPFGTTLGDSFVQVTTPGAGTVDMEIFEAPQPSNTGSNAQILQTYWKIFSGALASLDLNFSWPVAAVNGTESSYVLGFFDGSSWTLPGGTVVPSTHNASITGVTTYAGDWTVGAAASMGGATVLELTSDGNADAGVAETFTITARDSSNAVATSYSGDHTIVFSGAATAPDGSVPTATDKNAIDVAFGTNTILTFTNGVATTSMKLYTAELASVDLAEAGGPVSAGTADTLVAAGPASAIAFTDINGGNPLYANAAFSVAVSSTDAYGNTADVPSDTAITLSLANCISCSGTLSGTTTGTIPGGSNVIGIGPIQYSAAESNVILTANGGALGTTDSSALTFGAQVAGFVVTTTADSGTGSLREAITRNNNGECSSPCNVTFNIGSGAQTIAPLSALPAISSPIFLDATSQPGYVGTPIINLDGASAGASVHGLQIEAGGSTVKGLVVGGFSGIGIRIGTDGNVVQNCWVGLAPSGVIAAGNATGIALFGSSNSVGGTLPAERNVVSGNSGNGITIGLSTNSNVVSGNYIGTDATGALAIGNAIGVGIVGNANTNTIGGTTAGSGNVIAGNSTAGIQLQGSGLVGARTPVTNGRKVAGNPIILVGDVQLNVITGNYIGVAADGLTPLANTIGVEFAGYAKDNDLGAVGGGNVISGNGTAVVLNGSTTSGNRLFANQIGVGADGTTPVPNTTAAIVITGSSLNVIGGGTGEGNTIANNAGDGISIASGTGNTIVGNAIYANASSGIDLNADGADVQDDLNGDADAGANGTQNYGVLSGATVTGSTLDALVSFNSSATSANSVLVQLFEADTLGQGKTLLGGACIAGNQLTNGTISVPVGSVVVGDPIVTTATAYTDGVCSTASAGDGTSEFSSAFLAAACTPPPATITTAAATCAASSANSASVPATTGASYLWSILNGTIDSGQGTNAISYTAGATGSVTISVTVTSSLGCIGSDSKSVTINPIPPSTISTTTTSCPSATGLTASVPVTSGATYSWSITNGTIDSGAGTDTITYTAGASGTTTLNVTVTAASCSSSDTAAVSITPAPSATITTTATACPNATGLTASVPVTTGATYAWSITNGTIDAGNGADTISYTAGASGTTTLSVTVTAASCSSSDTKPVSIATPPPATITTATAACPASSGNSASVPLTSSASYAWSIANGTIDSGQGTNAISYTAGASGSVTISVTVTSSLGCTASDSKSVTITPPPPSTISTTTTACPNTTGLTASVPVTSGATYAWSITNGSIDAGNGTDTISYTTGAGGTTTLSVTVTAASCSSSDTKAVSIASAPTATISAPSSADPDTSLSASVPTQSGATYAWTVTNGTLDSGNGTPTINFTTGASGTTKLQVTVTVGSCSTSDTKLISIIPAVPLEADLSITKTAASTVAANDALTYSIGVTNHGPSDADHVTITDPLPTGTTLQSISGGSWNCTSFITGVQCIGAVAAGETKTIAITVKAPAVSGTITNTATLASSIDTTPGNNSASASTSVTSSSNCEDHEAPQLTAPASGATLSSPVTLSWTAVAGATGYRVWAEVNGLPAEELGTTTELSMTAEVGAGTIVAYVDALFPGCPAARSSSIAFTVSQLSGCERRTTATPLTPANGAVLGSSSVSFEWAAANDPDGYRLWISINGGTPSVLGTTVDETTFDGIIPAGTIEWWVESLYDGCASTMSSHSTFSIPAAEVCTTDVPSPLSPADGSTTTYGEVNFTWTPVSGALAYELWLAVEHGTPTLMGTTTATSFDAIVPDGALEWFVRAILDRCPQRDSATSHFTYDAPEPCIAMIRPDGISPLQRARTSSPIHFWWTPVENASGYDLYIRRGNGEPELVRSVTTNHADQVPVSNGNMRWFVRAHVPGCAPMEMSERKTEIVPVPAACSTLETPQIAAIGQVSSGVPFLIQWTPSPGATSYELQIATDITFADAETISTPDPQFEVTRTNLGGSATPLYARVRPIDARCQPVPTVGEYGLTAAIYVLPLEGVEGSAPANGHGVTHNIELGPELAGQSFVASVKESWLTVTPSSGVVAEGGTTLVVTADVGSLPVGTTLGSVTVTLTAPASARSAASNGTTFNFSTITVGKVTPVTPTPKSTPPPDALIIPAVAHSGGINAKFQSDVRLTNSSARAMQYLLTFTPSGDSGIATGRQTTFSVDPGRTVALDDVLRSWFGTGDQSVTGTLEIRPQTQTATSTSSAALNGLPNIFTFAASRTFNTTANGSFGQYIPAVPFANFIGRGVEGSSANVLSLQQIAQSDRYRTNLGLVEGSGEPASLLVKVFGQDGQKMTEFPVQLAGGQHLQLNSFLTSNGVSSLNDGRVEVSVLSPGGKVTAYASVLDNATSDPLLVTPVTLSETGNTKWVVPGVADLQNSEANWQTDMRLFNAGSEDVDVDLSFISQTGAAPSIRRVKIRGGQVMQFDKTLPSLFGVSNDGGAVHITTSSAARLIATARTYNQTTGGTYGQFISAVTPEEAAALNTRPLQILQVEESERFRSNVGIAEVTGNAAMLEIAVVPPDSKFTAVTQMILQPNEFRQLNSLLRSVGLADTYNARVSVRVIGGTGRVTAYASVIDMLTNDPTYVPAQ